jgi:hypothetical protein
MLFRLAPLCHCSFVPPRFQGFMSSFSQRTKRYFIGLFLHCSRGLTAASRQIFPYLVRAPQLDVDRAYVLISPASLLYTLLCFRI